MQWFEQGGDLKVSANAPAPNMLAQLKKIPGLYESLDALSVKRKGDPAIEAAAAEFVLGGFVGAQANQPQRRARLLRGGAPQAEELATNQGRNPRGR